MDDLTQGIVESAAEAIAIFRERTEVPLDYSAASLGGVEELLTEAASYKGQLSPDERQQLAQFLGCYVLEVARRAFGGRYHWLDAHDQPVLVVGEPAARVSLLALSKVQQRMTGEVAETLPAFYDSFAARARQPAPGTDVLFV